MSPGRFSEIVSRYRGLRVVVIGDFCLDRYLEIDPEREEVSIETGLPVHNILQVRSQPGAAGTVLNNLAALGVGCLLPVGFHGCDGEGFELRRAMQDLPGVDLRFLVETPLRRTFTYTKPLLMHRNAPPQELSRLDLKNWNPTPAVLGGELAQALLSAAQTCDALVVMDQTDQPTTGTVVREVLEAIGHLRTRRPELPIFADSRSGLGRFPSCRYKLNAHELARLLDSGGPLSPAECSVAASKLAAKTGQPVYVTLSENGILCAAPSLPPIRVPSLPVRGPIDVVGAGDCVTANLAAAVAAEAGVEESLELAMLACSHVVHQLGTSGACSLSEMEKLLPLSSDKTAGEVNCSTGMRPRDDRLGKRA